MILKNNITRAILLCTICFSVFFTSCEYEVIQPEVPVLPPDGVPISFKTDIFPFYSDNCAACHTGLKNLDFSTVETAYTSINTDHFINKTTPSESLIITKIEPGHNGRNYTTTAKALLIKWIEEGAQDN